MSTTITDRTKAMRTVKAMRKDSSLEEIIERLHLLARLERGIADADAGRLRTTAQVLDELSKWRP